VKHFLKDPPTKINRKRLSLLCLIHSCFQSVSDDFYKCGILQIVYHFYNTAYERLTPKKCMLNSLGSYNGSKDTCGKLIMCSACRTEKLKPTENCL